MDDKQSLRRRLRELRRKHVAALPQNTRALLFRRPPSPVLALIPGNAAIGLYCAMADEAPAAAYARFFHERGHELALPRFASRAGAMEFRHHSDPQGETDLEPGPFGAMQPGADAPAVTPQVLFAPLVGFTADGLRLGQGGGHYDRWLAGRPDTVVIGLAWDCQLVDTLPMEPHDRRLDAVITPTRLYGPF